MIPTGSRQETVTPGGIEENIEMRDPKTYIDLQEVRVLFFTHIHIFGSISLIE
jgi:hypothetical protein